MRKLYFLALAAAMSAPALTAGAEAITSTPAGELLQYERSALGYYKYYGILTSEQISGKAGEVVRGTDGCVYFKNIISQLNYPSGAVWVKGELNGSTISITFPQVAYIGVDGVTWQPMECDAYAMDMPDDGSGPYTSSDQTVTFEVNDDWTTITQTSPQLIGVYSGTGNGTSWMGYADTDNVFSKIDAQPTKPPYGTKYQQFAMTWEGNGKFLKAAVVDDEIYVRGLLASLPTACFKGKIEGDKVTFEGAQYLGVDGSTSSLAYVTPAVRGSNGDFSLTDRLVMDYDAQTMTLSVSDPSSALLVNAGSQTVNPIMRCADPRLWPQEQTDDPMTPADPVISSYEELDESLWDYVGYALVRFRIPLVSTDGKLMDQSKLFYNVYFDEDPLVFETDIYTHFEEELTDIPFAFNDGFHLTGSGTNKVLYMLVTGYDRVGLQSIYNAGGQENRSQVVYDVSTGLQEQSLSHEADRPAVYYDLTGRRVANPAAGIYVRVQGGKAQKVKL